jgi:type IV pilus assembly protein PilB
MINLPASKLKDILLRAGLVDEVLFERIKEEADRKQQSFADLLIAQGIINKDYLHLLIARALGVERVNFSLVHLDEEILRLLPEEVARRKRTIVFQRDPGTGRFQVAMEDPTDLETIDFLQLKLGGPVEPFLATEEDLNQGFSLYEKKQTQDFKTSLDQSIRESLRAQARGSDEEAAKDLPIMAIVDNLLAYAASSRASDIHFEVLEDGVMVRYRVDGILHEIIRMPKEIHPAVVARIKILSQLRIDEHSKPQDGRFRHKIGGMNIDVRVSVIPTFYGEKIVMRLFTAAQRPISMADLGLNEESIKTMQQSIAKTYGMVLVCGPTGSGKTTTLYSVLNLLNRPEVNIITIEDPVEYDMRYVNQMQVNVAAGITFASGLRSILRQDPNIIMVGEIRDGETANISIQAALTGHLVLSSVHTNDAVTAIPRLVDMGVPPFLVSAVLNDVLAQRLVRKVCIECIESYTPSVDVLNLIRRELQEIGVDPNSTHLAGTFYRGRGCKACGGTGFNGRLGIFEILAVTEGIRKLIISPSFNLDNLRKTAREEGMISMFEDGLRKVERGLTTIEEVLRVVRE